MCSSFTEPFRNAPSKGRCPGAMRAQYDWYNRRRDFNRKVSKRRSKPSSGLAQTLKTERFVTGFRLRERFLQCEKEEIDYAVIAHSHGGSIVWHALLGSVASPRHAPPDSRPRSALHGRFSEPAAGQWRDARAPAGPESESERVRGAICGVGPSRVSGAARAHSAKGTSGLRSERSSITITKNGRTKV